MKNEQKAFIKDTELAGFQSYIPEMWTVPKDSIYYAQSAISAGLGYAKEILENLKKKEPKNHTDNLLIQCVENDIRTIKQAQAELAKLP